MNQTMTTRINTWTNEAANLEAIRAAKPLTAKQHKRLCDLNSSLDTYSLLDGSSELPTRPWITRALKAS